MNKNIPFQKHEVEEYEKKRYRGIDQKIVHSRENALISRIIKQTGENSGFILDLPCGYGRFSGLLKDFGFSVISSDLSFFMISRAVNRSLRRDAVKSGVVSDAKKGLPFLDQSFPLIFSMRFFHHLHDSQDRISILREFARVSAEWVVLSFYRFNSLHRLQLKLRKKVSGGSTRIKMITLDEFRDEIREAGLRLNKTVSLFRGIHAQQFALLQKIRT
jgi:SAM-dependent methyltransferase